MMGRNGVEIIKQEVLQNANVAYFIYIGLL
jgi:hypothetical protein